MTDEEMKQYADEHWKCVVYCKECKYMVEWELPDMSTTGLCAILKAPVTPNFWCADGERKR